MENTKWIDENKRYELTAGNMNRLAKEVEKRSPSGEYINAVFNIFFKDRTFKVALLGQHYVGADYQVELTEAVEITKEQLDDIFDELCWSGIMSEHTDAGDSSLEATRFIGGYYE